MKHTKKRFLAIALVLAMMLGMVPLAVLSVGAEVTDIQVDEEGGFITDLGWNNGYIGSPTNSYGNQWKICDTGSAAYRYSDIVNVPKAGTTLVWSESTAAGTMSNNAMLVTSWKEVTEGVWEIDTAGTNLAAVKNVTNANQYYDDDAQKVTYTYTTTKDNEKLRFSCYGGLENGSIAASAADCPKVYVYTPAFVEGDTVGQGKIEGLLWNSGYSASYTNDYSAPNGLTQMGAVGNDYNYSSPIIVPKAGTTISFTERGSKFSTEQAYVFTTLTVDGMGRLQLFNGLVGGSQDSAWMKVNEEDGSRTYFYTTAYDNEIIRITCRGEAYTNITYKENNAEACPSVLLAAGYDAAQAGTPYMVAWYNGLMGVESESIIPGSPMYSFSDIIPVYGKGTTVTFTDMVLDGAFGASNFAAENVFVVAKFNGENYNGASGANDVVELVSGVMTGDSAADRENALAAGKRTYTYTTTEDIEYLRVGISNVGNAVNGGLVMPLVYVAAPGVDAYYNEMEGLKLVAIGDSYFYGGGADNDDTWVNRLGAKYGMQYYNYGINGSTVSNYVAEQNPMVDRYADMVDGADIVIFEGGRNDYNVSAPMGEIGNTDTTTFLGAVQTMLAGLMEKYPNALIVCVTPWDLVDLDATGLTSNKVNEAGLRTEDYANAFADYVDSLQNDRVIAIRSFDNDVMPVFMGNATFRDLFCVSENDISHLNKDGHKLVLPWFEAVIGPAYRNFTGISGENNMGLTFVNGGDTVAIYGTASGARNIKIPKAPAGIASENFFGWVGTVTNGGNTQIKVLPAGQTVSFAQGDTAVFEPLALGMEQTDRAELRVDEDAVGLRFIAAIAEADYTALMHKISAGVLGEATVSVGMLIVPAEYVLEVNGDLTHASLDAKALKRVDAVSTIADNGDGTYDWYDYDGDNCIGYVAGTVCEILQENHARKFTARGYVKLTVNGEDYYVYAQNGGRYGKTIYDEAIEALNDASKGPHDEYQNVFTATDGSTAYSPYTAEQRALLATFVDDVIALESKIVNGLGCTGAELVHYEYYDPNVGRFTTTMVGGGVDSLTDIFYPYAPGASGAAAVQNGAWSMLIEALGNDNDITSVCVILATEGYEITANGGIMLDGFICDLNDVASSVKCVEFEFEGETFYLLGFCDYGVFY